MFRVESRLWRRFIRTLGRSRPVIDTRVSSIQERVSGLDRKILKSDLAFQCALDQVTFLAH